MGNLFEEFYRATFNDSNNFGFTDNGNSYEDMWANMNPGYKSPFTKKYFIDGVAYDNPIIDARETNVVTTVLKTEGFAYFDESIHFTEESGDYISNLVKGFSIFTRPGEDQVLGIDFGKDV